MSALVLNLHHKTPEKSKIEKVINILKDGGVILYPTDTGFTLGCELENKEAISKLRRIRRLPEDKSLTFLCDSLSNVAEFAKVSNEAYKTIKGLIPGPYTFILPASKLVPKFAQNPKRKTSGIRVPDSTLAQELLRELGAPIISISAKTPEGDEFDDVYELFNYFKKQVDVAVTSDEYDFTGKSTVIDMTEEEFKIIREGAGMEKVNEFMYFES